MQNFLRYKETGFQLPSSTTAVPTNSIANGSFVDWRYYIQSMIMKDPIDIRVITTPQKGMYPDGSAIRMQYYQNIEPRKIGWVVILHHTTAAILTCFCFIIDSANKILQIFETVVQELRADLSVKFVELENAEIARYASAFVLHGQHYADKNRKVVR